HHGNLLQYDLRELGDTALKGYRVYVDSSRELKYYFYAVFSKPFIALDQLEEREAEKNPEGKNNFTYTMIQMFRMQFLIHGELLVKVAISSVSMEDAMNKLYSEAPHWNFERYLVEWGKNKRNSK
ncbi:MAG: hypothetical protein IT223_04805, partial [Crocinitomicaceae bacterium]|nr:hypothetical protein [Crocinitomicaceae bacterium]